jgi:hypothetical protein
MVHDGDTLKVRADFDERPEGSMVHLHYGFVLSAPGDNDPYNTQDGHLDAYLHMSLTYEQLDILVAAYQARKEQN